MSAKLIINQEHNGLELYFSEKPDEDVLTALKAASWRYHRVKKCWYARQTPVNAELAHRFSQGDSMEVPSKSPTTPMPAYDCVDGTSIFESADISIWEHHEGYFADIHAFVSVKPQRIIIKDLRNALVPGKECERLTLEPEDVYSSECLFSGLNTFREVYDKFYVRGELPDCHVYRSQSRSMQTFTPFRLIRPIQPPVKWTLPHVWKAILSGQIFDGQVDGRYTDDYAYDAAMNFRAGVKLHLPSFAQELIESPSGWHVTANAQDDGIIRLSVNCHSFYLNTLLFDAKCDWPENIRRRQQRAEALQKHNVEMQARLLTSEQVMEKTADGLLFDATVLRMNDNTGRYETHSELLMRSQVVEDERLWRDVVDIVIHPIEDDALFDIECSSLFHADDRVMLSENGAVVTGKTLLELLSDPHTAEMIGEVQARRQTLAAFRASLEDWRDGRIRSLFNPVPTARMQLALDRLDQEEARIHETV